MKWVNQASVAPIECNIIYIHRAHCARETRALSIILLKWEITFSVVLFTPSTECIIEWYYGMLKERVLIPFTRVFINAKRYRKRERARQRTTDCDMTWICCCHWPLLFIYNFASEQHESLEFRESGINRTKCTKARHIKCNFTQLHSQNVYHARVRVTVHFSRHIFELYVSRLSICHCYCKRPNVEWNKKQFESNAKKMMKKWNTVPFNGVLLFSCFTFSERFFFSLLAAATVVICSLFGMLMYACVLDYMGQMNISLWMAKPGKQYLGAFSLFLLFLFSF